VFVRKRSCCACWRWARDKPSPHANAGERFILLVTELHRIDSLSSVAPFTEEIALALKSALVATGRQAGCERWNHHG
jgi:hypothetical protein